MRKPITLQHMRAATKRERAALPPGVVREIIFLAQLESENRPPNLQLIRLLNVHKISVWLWRELQNEAWAAADWQSNS
jgi:hypothetical protein